MHHKRRVSPKKLNHRFFVYLRSRDDCENIYEGVHKHQLEIKNEIEMTFVKILEEELLLEKNAD